MGDMAACLRLPSLPYFLPHYIRSLLCYIPPSQTSTTVNTCRHPSRSNAISRHHAIALLLHLPSTIIQPLLHRDPVCLTSSEPARAIITRPSKPSPGVQRTTASTVRVARRIQRPLHAGPDSCSAHQSASQAFSSSTPEHALHQQ